MVTALILFGTGWLTWTVRAELFHHCETEYEKNFDLIQIHLSLSIDGVRHCMLAFVALALTSLAKHNLLTVNETNVSNTGRLTCGSCCTIL